MHAMMNRDLRAPARGLALTLILALAAVAGAQQTATSPPARPRAVRPQVTPATPNPQPLQVVPLWPAGQVPGARGSAPRDNPFIQVFLPRNAGTTTTAVLICPGGGYAGVSMEFEGSRVAAELNRVGVAAFVLRYRLPAEGYKHPVPLEDVQRAMRLVRARAAEWKVNPSRLGVMGFSAGGHLAGTLSTHYDAGKKDAADPIDRQGCRPDFSVLMYGVLSMDPAITHRGSHDNLIGQTPDKALEANLSNEKQVTADTPPAFLAHANDDRAVPVENTINYYLALHKAGVPAEMVIYETGGHGFGFGRPGMRAPAGLTWMDRLEDWMRARGYLEPLKKP